MRVLFLALVLLMLTPWSRASEEPAFVLEQRVGAFEVRAYAPYVVAEVVISGPPENAGNLAFPILAGYIFGKNKGERQLPMTAPVTQTPAPAKLPMTAPVTQTDSAEGSLVQFILPRDISLATAPEPTDDRVRLREVPASRWGVIRYSGFWSTANDAEHLAQLKTALQSAHLAWRGPPVLARYNPPFTPWFLRRNEIWLSLP